MKKRKEEKESGRDRLQYSTEVVVASTLTLETPGAITITYASGTGHVVKVSLGCLGSYVNFLLYHHCCRVASSTWPAHKGMEDRRQTAITLGSSVSLDMSTASATAPRLPLCPFPCRRQSGSSPYSVNRTEIPPIV
jgi:hypothetical protein